MSTGKKIKEARQAAGLTQEQLAHKLNVKQATISAFENDKTIMKYETLRKIAKALDTNVYRLIGQDRMIYEDLVEEHQEEQISNTILDSCFKSMDFFSSIKFDMDTSKYLIQWVDDDGIEMNLSLDETQYQMFSKEIQIYFKNILNSLINDKDESGIIRLLGLSDSDRPWVKNQILLQEMHDPEWDYMKKYNEQQLLRRMLSGEDTINIEKIIEYYKRLNADGREEAVERVKELTLRDKYTK